MPLIRVSGEQAVENRKTNPFGAWGDRAAMNRVEPITKPSFKVPFKFERGSKIFTVGSCFARNVEDELVRRGFDVPMRKVLRKDEQPGIINNYGTPSIYNEFAWAFGERPFVAEDHIVEVIPGKFADLHLSPALRPEERDRVLARRKAITGAYLQAANCPVLIMTLGLVECWYDTKSGYYLNGGPRPGHLRSEPSRFEMHVLSFDECYDYLERTILILKKHGRKDLQILLTVSPVPLVATHRMEDVIVANMYSKSVLRAAAETLVAKYDMVTYYPSYESVMLSDRQRAWREDFVHVTHEIVALNVGRMVDKFIDGGGEDQESAKERIDAGGASVAVERAKFLRAGSREEAAVFFKDYGHLSKEYADFAMEHAGFLAESGDHTGALTVLGSAPANMPEIVSAIMRADSLVALGRAHDGYTVLDAFTLRSDGPLRKRLRASTYWHAYLETAKATGDETLLLGALSKLVKANPAHAARANNEVGHWFKDRGLLERAITFYEIAVSLGDEGNLGHLYLAECLTTLGRPDEARKAIKRLRPRGKGAEYRAERLLASLGRGTDEEPIKIRRASLPARILSRIRAGR